LNPSEPDPATGPDTLIIRPARLDDLSQLTALEQCSFRDDRLTRRQFRHLISRGNSAVLVAESGGHILGNTLLLFSRATANSRLYSIAVAPEARGRGIAKRLVEAAEAETWRRERAWIRLEIRKDNQASINLFQSLGYRRFGEYGDYYADHMDAWRFEKRLDQRLSPELARVPFYRQTLDFTCGPACLIMAMQTLDKGLVPGRMLELRLWREATTIFMTSGHGGCGPYGLALAAHRRGFRVEIIVSDPGLQMLETVRNEEKKEVMALVQADMEAEIAQLGIPLQFQPIDLELLERKFRAGFVPLVLISAWWLYREIAPHWVVITGFDDHFVYLHNPFVDTDQGEAPADSINMPFGRELFLRMCRYGRKGLQATVLIGPQSTG